jgi:hypothetical protein
MWDPVLQRETMMMIAVKMRTMMMNLNFHKIYISRRSQFVWDPLHLDLDQLGHTLQQIHTNNNN